MLDMGQDAAQDLDRFLGSDRFGCVLADPPWRFVNRTGKVAPEHKRLARYPTMDLDEIMAPQQAIQTQIYVAAAVEQMAGSVVEVARKSAEVSEAAA